MADILESTLQELASRCSTPCEEYQPEQDLGPELAKVRQDLRLIRTELAQLKARLTELERRFDVHVTPWWKRALPWGKKAGEEKWA